MSETLSHHQQDPGPDSIHSGPTSQLASHGLYTTLTAATVVANYPSQPGTPQDVSTTSSLSNLPPFSTFSNEVIDPSNPHGHTISGGGYGDQTRLLDISNWDYYSEGLTGRLLERNEHGLSIISSQQPQYRPWESTTSSQKSDSTISTFADAFAAQPNHMSSKLPSFQSQFQAFSDTANHGVNDINSSPTTLTTLTPMSPSSTSPNFHTLSTVNPRSYPLVPAPIQAREIPTMQQQFLEERHIQLYSHPTTGQLTTLNNAAIHFPTQNGAIIQNNQLIQGPVLTVIKTEPSTNFVDIGRTTTVQVTQPQSFGQPLHHSQFQNPLSIISHHQHPHEIGGGTLPPLYNGIEKKLNGFHHNSIQPQTTMISSPSRNSSDYRKKERRKIRASSLESSTTEGSDGTNSNMDGIMSGSNSMSNNPCENSGQVPSISSTAGFKSHNNSSHNNNHNSLNNTNNNNNISMDVDEISGGNGDKQVKKKRKRCGECIGCQRKDNCGDCAPCRNDKSHQICKQRRCEKLTEKKILYAPDGSLLRGQSRRGRGRGRGGRTVTDQGNLYAPDGSLLRGESRRGRGKGRGSYRGRKAAGGNAGGGIITGNSVTGTTGIVTSQIVTTSSSGQQQPTSLVGGGIITSGGISLPEASPQSQSAPTPVVPSARPSPPINSHLHPQQVMLKPADQAAVPPTHQPMTPMPFYADPNRFPTPVWQADPSQGWAQGQFIQQIPAQPTLEAYHTQQYTNPPTIYQANYPQTPSGFEPTNTFYTGPVQVLTNQRPPSASSHTSAALTPRPTNGSYTTHTPSPSPMVSIIETANLNHNNSSHNTQPQMINIKITNHPHPQMCRTAMTVVNYLGQVL